MKNKRGQITLFIILGIIVLIITLLIIYFVRIKVVEIPPEVTTVKIFIEDCLENTAKDGIYLIGLQGGYYNTVEPYLTVSPYKVPFYYYLDKEKIPNRRVIENELLGYIESNIGGCIKNFESFNETDFKFKTSRPKAHVTITNSKILTNLDYPIMITKGKSETRFNSFIYEINFDFNGKYNIAKKIIEEQKMNSTYFPLGYLTIMSYENDFVYNLDQSDDSIAVHLIFNESMREDPFIYSFAIKYKGESRNVKNEV